MVPATTCIYTSMTSLKKNFECSCIEELYFIKSSTVYIALAIIKLSSDKYRSRSCYKYMIFFYFSPSTDYCIVGDSLFFGCRRFSLFECWSSSQGTMNLGGSSSFLFFKIYEYLLARNNLVRSCPSSSKDDCIKLFNLFVKNVNKFRDHFIIVAIEFLLHDINYSRELVTKWIVLKLNCLVDLNNYFDIF